PGDRLQHPAHPVRRRRAHGRRQRRTGTGQGARHPPLVLLAIVQVVFCGALLELDGVPGLEQLSWLLPSRWGLGAIAGTVRLARMSPGDLTSDPIMRHSVGVWLLDVGMLVVLSALFAFGVSRLLRRHEPVVMRR